MEELPDVDNIMSRMEAQTKQVIDLWMDLCNQYTHLIQHLNSSTRNVLLGRMARLESKDRKLRGVIAHHLLSRRREVAKLLNYYTIGEASATIPPFAVTSRSF